MPSKENKIFKQMAIVLFLAVLTLLISLFAAKQLKGKTAATPEEVFAYQDGKLELENLRTTIEKYRDDNENTLPDNLGQLAPGYFSKEPLDPFGNEYDYDKWKNGDVALLSFFGRDGVPKGLGINKDYVLRIKRTKED